MRRLSGALAGRLRGEHGAIAVVVAVSMTVLLGFAAVAIDTSAARRDQQVLRNAADAAALAVALDCARAALVDAVVCPVVAATAEDTATGLVSDNAGNGSTVTTSLVGREVTVTVSADASRPIPIGPGTVSVTSRAEWTTTIGYTASYPLAISYCRYLDLQTAQTPSHLASEPNGLWLLPTRQQISPAAGNAIETCNGPSGSLVLPNSVMTPTDADAACGPSPARGRNVTGEAFEPVAFAARTCVAGSQSGDVTSRPWGGYQVILPVFDRVDGNRYHVWDYLGFHVMGVTADGGLWGFSMGKADPALGTPVSFVRLTA